MTFSLHPDLRVFLVARALSLLLAVPLHCGQQHALAIELENEGLRPQTGWIFPGLHFLRVAFPGIYVETSQAFGAHWLCEVSDCDSACEAGLLLEAIRL